jgi:hypothetical protein
MARYRQRRANKAPTPSPALTEMLAKTGELDRILDGRGPSYQPAQTVGPPPESSRPFVIEPPDWDQEHREHLERERAERARRLEAAERRRQEQGKGAA